MEEILALPVNRSSNGSHTTISIRGITSSRGTTSVAVRLNFPTFVFFMDKERKNTLRLVTCFVLFTLNFIYLSGQPVYETGKVRFDLKKSLDLPGIPEFIVEPTDQTTPGYYIFDLTPDLMIIDHYGNPLFYKNIPGGSRNFELQPNGSYSYYASSTKGFMVMDEFFHITDTFIKVNEALIDFHEFNILENGNYILLGYDRQVVDMSQYITGGKPSATVTGMVFQELDPGKNLLFEWNSWDHISFMDSDTVFVDLTANSIDYMHSNSIAIDQDGHYLLSSRHLSEVTKINSVTGDIIWRFGGSQNEFDFTNDTIGFSGQHSVLRLPNGNIALFDNGNGHTTWFSRGVEYEIDESEMTATLIRECRELPDTYSPIMGNVTSLPGNHLVVGWGKNSNDNLISEYDEMGNKVTGIYPTPGEILTSYKVSYLEEFSFFVTPDEDTLDFGIVNGGDSAVLMVELINSGLDSVTLFSFSDESNQFSIEESLPIQLEGSETRQINLKFQPIDTGYFFVPAYLNFRLDSTIDEEHMVACRIMLEGYSPTGSSTIDSRAASEVSIFPNPFNDQITFMKGDDVERIVLWSLTGKKVYQVQNRGDELISADLSYLVPGMYIVEFQFMDGNRIYRKVVKQ